MSAISPAARAPVVMLAARPFDDDLTVDLLDWPLPTGEIGLPVENQFSLSGGITTVRVATEGFTTGPSDTPADTWIGPYLAEAFNFSVQLFSGVEPTGERGQAGTGRIDIADPDGDLDAWLAYAWDGRALDLYRGDAGDDPLAMTLIASLTCDGMLHDLRGKYFRMRDLQYRLYQSTFALHRYGGTGGADGDATLAGVPMPMVFGKFFDGEPTPHTSATLIYQIHFRRMQEVTAVRDGGSTLTFDADYGSYAALVAAGVAAGFYSTCLAAGFIRTGSTPTFGLRVDGKGDALGGVYAETRGAIARRIATTIGDLPLGDPTNIDTTSFSDMDTAQPATIGIMLRESAGTIGEVLDRLMAGCAGWWTVSLTGLMRVGTIEEPDVTADYVLAYRPDMAGEPELLEAPPPRAETSVGWRRNWAPQDPANLAGSVSAEDRRLYQQLWSFSDPAQGKADNIATRHLAARRVFAEGYYAEQADADTEAARQRTLFSTARRRWRIRMDVDPYTDLLGKTVEITGVERLGWGASMNFRCIGIEAIGSAEHTILTLWG